MKSFKSKIGEKSITKDGHELEIIGHRSYLDLDVLFTFDGSVLSKISYKNFKLGKVVHPSLKRKRYGVGYFSQEKVDKEEDLVLRAIGYRFWSSMLKRGYSKLYKKEKPCYEQVEVCVQWHCFQNFFKWFSKNYDFETMEGWELDKDIIEPENKIYSSETCCFVPKQINKFFINMPKKNRTLPKGVSFSGKSYEAAVSVGGKVKKRRFSTAEEAFKFYCEERKSYAIELANKWGSFIDSRVKERLINFEV